jgi:mono/diheme cytochrome c family protein
MAESKGQELFTQKCATCHASKGDAVRSQRVAPPIKNVMYHMNDEFKTKEDIKKHIMDFVVNPTKEKALCPSVRKFGVMPSQKGIVSSKDLETITNWLVNDLETISKEEYSKHKKNKKH